MALHKEKIDMAIQPAERRLFEAKAKIPVNRTKPLIAVKNGTVRVGETMKLSDLVTISDPDGNDTLVDIWANDETKNGGYLRYRGQYHQGQLLTIHSLNDFNQVEFVAAESTTSDSLLINASDGKYQAGRQSLTITTQAPQNDPPRVTIKIRSSEVAAGQAVRLDELVSVSDPQGDGTIEKIRIVDLSEGGGRLQRNGQNISGTYVDVALGDLGQVIFRGASGNASDQLRVGALDKGGMWSNQADGERTLTITSKAPQNDPPTVEVDSAEMTAGQELVLANYIRARDPEGASIRLVIEDPKGAGSLKPSGDGFQWNADTGRLTVPSVQALSNVKYVSPKGGSETLRVMASDGKNPSPWAELRITAKNASPRIEMRNGSASVKAGETLKLSDLVTISDPDGNDSIKTITVVDQTSDGGYLRYTLFSGEPENPLVR